MYAAVARMDRQQRAAAVELPVNIVPRVPLRVVSIHNQRKRALDASVAGADRKLSWKTLRHSQRYASVAALNA